MPQQPQQNRFRITRRRFAFWIGFGAFTLGEKLNASCLDEIAALGMGLAPPSSPDDQDQQPEHWRRAENSSWHWFERETYVDGQWKVTGRTTPVNKDTGKALEGRSGYLSDDLVPKHVRAGKPGSGELPATHDRIEPEHNTEAGSVSAARRARHGRPPSKWLRSLEAEEIRTWLKTIEVPETGVSGMTFWTHLTRDHSFDAEKIEGLTETEQAKLHSAAHYGY